MKKRRVDSVQKATLRRQATELAASRFKTNVEHSPTEARLIQELEIHRIELEMQNEELRAAQCELEAHLDRYTQLFDFAPIGYAALTSDGTVREVNHVG